MGFFKNEQVTFETCDNNGPSRFAEWETEWSTMRRFKIPYEGLKVWEGGAVELLRTGVSDPAWRYSISHLGMFEVLTKKELPQLYWGDKKVFKTCLYGSCYVVDHASGRVFNMARVRGIDYTIRWAHPNTCPVPASNISGYVPNRKRMKQFVAAHTVLFTKADAVFALDGTRKTWEKCATIATHYFNNPVDPEPALLAIGIMRNQHGDLWGDFVTRFTADKFNTQYLTLKPNGL